MQKRTLSRQLTA